MDERHEELAALNALGMLESDEKRVLSGISLADKDLRWLSTELEHTVAELAHLITPVEPPADLKRRIRAKVRERGGAMAFLLSRNTLVTGGGWVLAAVFALFGFWQRHTSRKLSQQLDAVSRAITPATASASTDVQDNSRTLEENLKQLHADLEAKKAAFDKEIASLRQSESQAQARVTQLTAENNALKHQDPGKQLQITNLQSEVWEFRRSSMLVIWDSTRHLGVLLLDKMPRAESGKDYQLWIVDPQQSAPVSAGVIAPDEKGVLKMHFKPVADVGDAVKFMLSMEKKGGATVREGKIVFGSSK
ncbi:MAG: anti-sigma factor [Verrucomicrobiaceae bacterium]